MVPKIKKKIVGNGVLSRQQLKKFIIHFQNILIYFLMVILCVKVGESTEVSEYEYPTTGLTQKKSWWKSHFSKCY